MPHITSLSVGSTHPLCVLRCLSRSHASDRRDVYVPWCSLMCDPQSTGWMADDISSRQPPLKKENCSLSLSHPITNQLPFSCDAKKKTVWNEGDSDAADQRWCCSTIFIRTDRWLSTFSANLWLTTLLAWMLQTRSGSPSQLYTCFLWALYQVGTWDGSIGLWKLLVFTSTSHFLCKSNQTAISV